MLHPPSPRAATRTRRTTLRCLLLLLLAAVLLSESVASAGPLIDHVWTDKAQYRTGNAVNLYVRLYNKTGASWTGTVGVYPRHLGRTLNKDQSKTVTVAPNAMQTLTYTFSITTPNDRGYLAEVWCWKNSGGATDIGSTSFDFSSNWTKFPRYGYLSRFHDSVGAPGVIVPMRDYKVNAIQYYDWADKHHKQYATGALYWEDLSRHSPWVSKAKLTEMINLSRGYNMSSMAYQLINGAYDSYWNEGVQLSWGAFKNWSAGTYTPADQDRHELGIPAWETPRIYLFNPNNQGWRDWIAADFRNVFTNIAFDGWHMDTLGPRGTMYDWNKNTFDLAGSYPGFVNNIKSQLPAGKFIAFNTVANYGEPEIASGSNVDIIYSELWGEGDEDDFYDINTVLNNIRSRTTKSTVLAGYMNYNYAKGFSDSSPGFFREGSILRADAAIFASGGWHIELGDGLNLLCNEYFPNKTLVMSADLKAKLKVYYDFAVAYENLLRDGVYDGNKRVDFDHGGSTPSGYDGSAGRVWKLAKWRGGADGVTYYDIAHFINLRGCAHTKWRDPDATFLPPTEELNKRVRLYYNDAWGTSKVWYASPDYEAGKAVEVPVSSYTNGWDSSEGKWYIEFTLPRLKYWTMAWLERRP